MGGHGGLNILPQKKWNVYNADNRTIVDNDIRQAQERQKQREQEQTDTQLELKMEILKIEKKKQQGKNEESEIVRELKESIQNKNINLFQNEEIMIENQMNTKARIEQEQNKFKDKPYDQSTKFMGTLDLKQNQPWYNQQKKFIQKENTRFLNKHKIEEKYNFFEEIKKFDQNQDSFYKILPQNNKEKKEKTRKKEKSHKKDKKKSKKNDKKKDKENHKKKIKFEDVNQTYIEALKYLENHPQKEKFIQYK